VRRLAAYAGRPLLQCKRQRREPAWPTQACPAKRSLAGRPGRTASTPAAGGAAGPDHHAVRAELDADNGRSREPEHPVECGRDAHVALLSLLLDPLLRILAGQALCARHLDPVDRGELVDLRVSGASAAAPVRTAGANLAGEVARSRPARRRDRSQRG